GCGDIGVGDPAAAVLLRPEGCLPDEVDPDPDILLAGGDLRDPVDERSRQHPGGVETLPDPVGQDLADLGPRVGQEGDLGRVEDRPDARIGLGSEVQAEVARDREDPCLPDVPLLVEPEELVEEEVVGPAGMSSSASSRQTTSAALRSWSREAIPPSLTSSRYRPANGAG
ncbi:hypothetical protein, partial [Methanoculleus chikugoensis]|uniref:hypothetical protein n=1 Tax=Methanoculleus chikugoensis TaxID=118126 RepID=UPI001FB369B7